MSEEGLQKPEFSPLRSAGRQRVPATAEDASRKYQQNECLRLPFPKKGIATIQGAVHPQTAVSRPKCIRGQAMS